MKRTKLKMIYIVQYTLLDISCIHNVVYLIVLFRNTTVQSDRSQIVSISNTNHPVISSVSVAPTNQSQG